MRVTEQQLRELVTTINYLLQTPTEPYREGTTANVKAFFLRRCKGGYLLSQMMDKKGNSRDVFGLGCMPKKSLYECTKGFIMGIEKAIEMGEI